MGGHLGGGVKGCAAVAWLGEASELAVLLLPLWYL